MKKVVLIIIIIFFTKNSYAQTSASFNVGGDIDKFYPVTFYDGGWYYNAPTNLILGRSSVHTDSDWRGSLMAAFNFHVTAYGHGSNFIDANIKPSIGSVGSFIAEWRDATGNGTCTCIIIWLRGGGTTYYYQSNYPVNPTVYDGVQNPLPYNEVNGPAHSFRTTVEEYAIPSGTYQNRNAYFAANVGIGTINPDEKLTVKGKIHTQEVRVDMAGPLVPDYVFANDYKLKSLQEVEDFIKENKHLPEIPSAHEIEKNGLMLAEMNMNLLKKIEEMTLYMIEIKKEMVKQNDKILTLESKLKSKAND
ncbi:tail fiber protein [Flavobacterium chilense]|uniref:Peptidase S74 domain-containing protein n=1 Tax=Flavobacterium chilense TaxID=946677 RepID=A0A1M7N0N0_9FLAO|nr:tail fiber protein [Flavobacterium chilense]SHM97085.1 hypothetical protein SAMN05444484_11718 [Flavobacterium chilense]